MDKTTIHAIGAPKAVGPYVHAVRAGHAVYTSGQVGLDPETSKLVPGGVAAETHRALDNLAIVLRAAGSGLDRVVKTTVFLTTMDDFLAMNGAYASHFPEEPPARSTVAVAALPLGAKVEIEAVGLVSD